MIGKREFAEMLIDGAREFLPKDCRMEVTEVTKNNGVELTGISVRCGSGNTGMVIYIDSLYHEGNQKAIYDFVDIVKSQLEKGLDDFSHINHLEDVRGGIVPRLINAGSNKKMKETCPHRMIADLMIVYDILVDTQSGEGRAHITNSLIGKWGINEEELHKIALENLPKVQPAKYTSFMEAVKATTLEGDFAEIEQSPFMILTSENNTYGATQILNGKIMDDIAEKHNGKVLIVPSSVHEVLIMPGDFDPNKINGMIREINSGYVEPTEILSDHAYTWDRQDGLKIA